jgi:tetratricopeptide (TPR) repeat protein
MDTILRTLPDDDTLLVAHADLYDRPRQLLETVAAFLGVRADADRLDAFADGFVEPGLRRAGAGQGDADLPLARVSRGLFEALSADGVPRRLPRWQARRIAEGPAGIAALRPLLPAVFASLSDASTVAARERERIRRLRRAANLLGDLATRQAPEAALIDRREEIDALAEGAGEDTDILCFRAAQIAERLGDLAAADRLFARAAEAAPHFAAAAAGRMRVLRRAGRAREAEAVRLAAAEAFPDNPAFRPG